MPKKSQTKQEPKQVGGENERKNLWVLLPIFKSNVLKKTEKYVLFDVDGSASAIINAKFLRKKEHDNYIFVSIPANFEITCRVKEYKQGKGYQVVKEYVVTAENLLPVVKAYNKVCESKPAPEKDELPF